MNTQQYDYNSLKNQQTLTPELINLINEHMLRLQDENLRTNGLNCDEIKKMSMVFSMIFKMNHSQVNLILNFKI